MGPAAVRISNFVSVGEVLLAENRSRVLDIPSLRNVLQVHTGFTLRGASNQVFAKVWHSRAAEFEQKLIDPNPIARRTALRFYNKLIEDALKVRENNSLLDHIEYSRAVLEVLRALKTVAHRVDCVA